MKKIVGRDIGNYTFDASAQTVTITGITGLQIQDILLIINIEDNEVIYSPPVVGRGGTLSGNILTLDFDTTLMDDADPLSIFVHNDNGVKFNSNALDASGRLPVSQVTILGSYIQDKNDNSAFLDRQGTGSQVYDPDRGSSLMSVTAGQFAVCQSKTFHPYITGKSQRIEITFIGMDNEADVNKKAGYYSSSIVSPFSADYDGIYLESDGSDHNFVVANNGSLTTIPRSNWDDPMDGTGKSGVNLDFSNFQVMVLDYLYLGGTSVRFAFKVGRDLIIAHEYQHSNVANQTIFRSSSQPIRWEIRSTTGTGSLEQICASVGTEGEIDIIGTRRSINTGSTHINANTIGTKYLINAIRLNDRRTYINEFVVSVLSETTDDYLVEIMINPTINNSGSLTWNAIPDTGADFTVGLTGSPSTSTVTGGTVVDSFYVYRNESPKNKVENLQRIGTTLDGVVDVWAVAVTPLGGNSDIQGSITLTSI